MCKVAWCNGKENISGKGYCRRHYDQMRAHGRILDKRTTSDPSRIIEHGDTCEIVITDRNDKYICSAIIDADKKGEVSAYRWTTNGNGYIRTFIGTSPVYLHRLIADAPAGKDVDHINHNRLDNRAQNLRIVTHAENCANRVCGRGSIRHITKRKLKRPYYARITSRGKAHCLGYYETETQAKEAIKAWVDSNENIL